MDGHGLALKLPQICPTKSGRILRHSQSCASVAFKRLRGTALDCDNMRWISVSNVPESCRSDPSSNKR